MAQPKPSKHPNDTTKVEPGADKRLAHILKKALNTPPSRHGNPPKPEKRPKAK